MNAWVYVTLWLLLLESVGRVVVLGFGKYPRETSSGRDVLEAVFCFVWFAWGCYLVMSKS